MLSARCLSCPVMSVCPVCDVRALWPNGWTDQDETWQAGRPWPCHIVLGGDPALPPLKRHNPSIFGPYLLWPNGCMDQDVILYGGRPRPRRLCVRWEPSALPPKGERSGPFLLWQNGCLHQNATWYRARPRPRQLCVRWGPRTPSPKGHRPPNFRSISVAAKWLHGSRCHLVWS